MQPKCSAGDLLLVVQEVHHEHFTRKGADLFLKKNISLIEALLGFNFKLTHLDGREYIVYTQAGEVVGDHDKKIIKGLGMPFYKNDELRGNLVVEFKVTMPKRGDLTAQQLQVLSQVLPGQANTRPSDSNYEML
jgi:DnaJ family protein A protein 2